MNIIDNFIKEYLQISLVVDAKEQGDILNKLSAFLEYTRIKDKQKALDFKENLQKALDAKLKICITGQNLAGKSSLINAILEAPIIPKNKSLNFIIKYSNLSYLKIHKNNKVITHNIEMLEVINECDFVEIFLNKEILEKVTIIESNNNFNHTEKYDFCICVNSSLPFANKCDFMVLNKVDLLTEEELKKISKEIKEKYFLVDSKDSVDSVDSKINQDSTPAMITSIIKKEDSAAFLKIFKEYIIPKSKALKYEAIQNMVDNLVKSTIKSYDELIQSYEDLSLIIKNQNFIEYSQSLYLEIQNNLEDILKAFREDFKDINEVFWNNIKTDKIDAISKNNILKVKKIGKKTLYGLDLDSIKNILFDDNNIYARKYRANFYRLSKLRDFAIDGIKSRREDFIEDIKIWQAKIQNFDKTITFISEIHIDNLVYFALKIYDNIINVFILLTSQIMLDLHSQISRIEALVENDKKLLIEFMSLKVNQELEKVDNLPDKNYLQNIINNIIDDYLFKTNTINLDILNSTAVEIKTTQSLKCERINKIIDDIKGLKSDINHLKLNKNNNNEKI